MMVTYTPQILSNNFTIGLDLGAIRMQVTTIPIKSPSKHAPMEIKSVLRKPLRYINHILSLRKHFWKSAQSSGKKANINIYILLTAQKSRRDFGSFMALFIFVENYSASSATTEYSSNHFSIWFLPFASSVNNSASAAFTFAIISLLPFFATTPYFSASIPSICA